MDIQDLVRRDGALDIQGVLDIQGSLAVYRTDAAEELVMHAPKAEMTCWIPNKLSNAERDVQQAGCPIDCCRRNGRLDVQLASLDVQWVLQLAG